MPKHYVYRMNHDTGYAPKIQGKLCTLAGCKYSKTGKKRNIEESAEKGSWVIGIGGNRTTKPDKLIYMLKVKENISIREFMRIYPNESKYLVIETNMTRVLVSREYYYFGKNAITLNGLDGLIVKTQGCKCPSDKDVEKLLSFLEKEGHTKKQINGKPNNPDNYHSNKNKSSCGDSKCKAKC